MDKTTSKKKRTIPKTQKKSPTRAKHEIIGDEINQGSNKKQSEGK